MTRALYDRIKEHALHETPNECCGIVSLNDGEALQVYWANNMAGDPQRHYLMDPADQLRIVREMGAGQRMAIYHSHPMGGPVPSLRDIRSASYPDAIYLIIGMGQGLVTKAWRLRPVAREIGLEVY